jgi:hypothetical protein
MVTVHSYKSRETDTFFCIVPGSYSGGLEEYAEAAIFAHFIRTGMVLPAKQIQRCNNDEYLGGVLDFTGELNRFCVARATERDVAAVTKCRDVVDALMGIFLKVSNAHFPNPSTVCPYNKLTLFSFTAASVPWVTWWRATFRSGPARSGWRSKASKPWGAPRYRPRCGTGFP